MEAMKECPVCGSTEIRQGRLSELTNNFRK